MRIVENSFTISLVNEEDWGDHLKKHIHHNNNWNNCKILNKKWWNKSRIKQYHWWINKERKKQQWHQNESIEFVKKIKI